MIVSGLGSASVKSNKSSWDDLFLGNNPNRLLDQQYIQEGGTNSKSLLAALLALHNPLLLYMYFPRLKVAAIGISFHVYLCYIYTVNIAKVQLLLLRRFSFCVRLKTLKVKARAKVTKKDQNPTLCIFWLHKELGDRYMHRRGTHTPKLRQRNRTTTVFGIYSDQLSKMKM